MSNKPELLSDEAMHDFLINGYLKFSVDFPAEFHNEIYREALALYESEGNPGNAVLDRVPALAEVFDSEPVCGALESILGPDYAMHSHRHGHLNHPGTKAQNNHQDSYEDDTNVRHQRCRWAMLFYYPQDVSVDMGPTGVTPGSQYFYHRNSVDSLREIAVTGSAGTVTVVHYDLWHRALRNQSNRQRFMMKFLFCRMAEPGANDRWIERQPEDRRELYRNLLRWNLGRNEKMTEGTQTDSSTSVTTLIEKLSDPIEAVRLQAAYELGELGSPAIPILVERLKHEAEAQKNQQNRYMNPSQLYSGYALSAVGRPAVPELCKLLRDPRWSLRAAASDILGDIGLGATDSIPALTDSLDDENYWVRRNAIEALGTIGPKAELAVPALAGALQDSVAQVRHNAALALARILPLGRDVESALSAALSDENVYVRGNAALALKRISSARSGSELR